MKSFTREKVKQISSALGEPEWVLKQRLEAWNYFDSLPMPSTKDEPWRRTDLRRFNLEAIGPYLNGQATNEAVPAYLGERLTKDETGGILVQVDGNTKKYEMSQRLKDQGIIFCDMDTAVREHP